MTSSGRRALLAAAVGLVASLGCDKGQEEVAQGVVNELLPGQAEQQAISEARALEATRNLAQIAEAARAYFEAEHATRTGSIVPNQFPQSAARTPEIIPCETPVESYRAVWTAPTWQALSFSTPDPHYFSYEFESTGNAFTARAVGDRDCDEVLEIYSISGSVTRGSVVRVGEIEVEDLGE